MHQAERKKIRPKGKACMTTSNEPYRPQTTVATDGYATDDYATDDYVTTALFKVTQTCMLIVLILRSLDHNGVWLA